MLNQPFNGALRQEGRPLAVEAMSAPGGGESRLSVDSERGVGERWMDGVRAACVCNWCLHSAGHHLQGRPLSKVY